MTQIATWLAVSVLVVEACSRGAIMRWCLRWVFRFFAVLEIKILKGVQRIIPPRYDVVGECVKCGKCCKEILFNPPRFIRTTGLVHVFVLYHRLAHNFSPVARGPDDEIIFACGHLKSDGRCGIHKWRPFLCRNFPVVPWFEVPKILPYCTYQVAARPVTQMKARLPIINARVAVHHPSPDPALSETEHFHLVDVLNHD